MAIRPLSDLINKDKLSPEQVKAQLATDSNHESTDNGLKLVREAQSYGLSMRDYLTLAVAPEKSENKALYAGLNGYEATKLALNLPHANDFERGVFLQAASNTFQTYAGTRALFPEIVDDMLKAKTRLEVAENIASIVSQSRTIDGSEMITTYMEDDADQRKTYTVSELGRVPMRSVRTSQNTVGLGKRGSGIEISYEFARRASLDILTPFAARILRDAELSKVSAATNILINGDGVNAAAQVINFSTFAGGVQTEISATNYKALSKFLMKRAKDGFPVDTLVCNYDMYVDLMFLYAPTISGNGSVPMAMGEMGAPVINTRMNALNGLNLNISLSSAVPAGKIICMAKNECIEELIEANSNISESERSIIDQSIKYVKTETTGYKLAIPEARVVLNILA